MSRNTRGLSPALAVAFTALALAATGLVILALGAPAAQAQDRDCSHFANQAAAQDFYEANGGPASDPHRLDADNDGVACESRPCPCRGAGQSPPPHEPAPPPPPRDRDSDGVPDASDACPDHAGTEPNGCPPPAPSGNVVVRVIDGDTLVIRNALGEVTVRLLGIDAPGTKCGGKQATSFLRKLARPGEAVEVATDETQPQFDKYGRLLAYVTGDDGRLMQTDMLRAGWAKVYVVGPRFARYKAFVAAQKKAKRRGVGLWAKCR